MTDTISFDVFDTVVTRNFAHPRDLFVVLGVQLRDAGVHRLEPRVFAQARWSAELTARKLSAHTEVLLDDIYAVLARELNWDPAAAERARDAELALESRHLRGIPLMTPLIHAARSKSGRVVFLSDMYLPSSVLRPWLAREGVIETADLLLISGEARGNKSSGQLFDSARQALAGDYSRWHHSGDHPFADVAKPRELGMRAAHLTHAHLTPREQKVRNSRGEFADPWRSLLAGAMRLARVERAPSHPRESVLWTTGATVAGPLFYGFVRWTLDEAERRGIRRLYFLAREGQILWRVAQAIQALEPGTVECRYLYASRLVFAGLDEIDSPEALRTLAAPTGHFHSVRQTLHQLALDEAWARSNLPTRFAASDYDANLPPSDREFLADWLLADDRRATLVAALNQRAANARAYLEAEGLRADGSIGIVDAGWFGSIHRNLERLLGGSDSPASLTGFYLGVMPATARKPRGAMLGYTNAFSPLPLLREESHKVLIELMAESDHGQVTGYYQADGRWHARLHTRGPAKLEEIQLIQNAILAFVRRALDAGPEGDPASAEFASTVIGVYRDFHDHPSPDEARVFGSLPHADQLFEQRHAPLCAEWSFGAVAAALYDYRKRPPHWWLGGQAALGHPLPLKAFRAGKKLYWRLRRRPE